MTSRNRFLKSLIMTAFTIMITSCATYYEKYAAFNHEFQTGEIEGAESLLLKDKKGEKRKTQLIYFMDRGVVAHMLGKFEESNEQFEKAYSFIEDYRKSHLNSAVSFVSNPNFTKYPGEDYEHLMLHYYKALNYLYLKKYESAIVEVKRMQIKLNALADKYKSLKINKYQKDAFIENLMGIIYDADRDYNNAFIAYRNSYEIYRDIYPSLFNIKCPLQLKKDLLRAAEKTGFHDKVKHYEEVFGIKHAPKEYMDGQLVFFWQNGLVPIKDEWSINFMIVRGQGGAVVFENEELGLSFPFYLPSNQEASGGLGDLRMLRVAFPKLINREPTYKSAYISYNNNKFPLELTQDIKAVAFQTLKQRMLKELGTSLLRLALKKAAEQKARQSSEGLGLAMAVLNTATEKADTRNWQTLPNQIYYTRIPIKEGTQKVQLTCKEKGSYERVYNFDIEGKNNQTSFFNFHSLESEASIKEYYYN